MKANTTALLAVLAKGCCFFPLRIHVHMVHARQLLWYWKRALTSVEFWCWSSNLACSEPILVNKVHPLLPIKTANTPIGLGVLMQWKQENWVRKIPFCWHATINAGEWVDLVRSSPKNLISLDPLHTTISLNYPLPYADTYTHWFSVSCT